MNELENIAIEGIQKELSVSLETALITWPTACVCVIGVPERENGHGKYGKIFEGLMAGKCAIC